MSKVYMMVTITNRNKRKDFRTFFKEYGLPVFLETIGRGTAQSEVLDYFGLTEADLEKCNVNTVTNAEEHQYLPVLRS